MNDDKIGPQEEREAQSKQASECGAKLKIKVIVKGR